jgi:hypothetical protein
MNNDEGFCSDVFYFYTLNNTKIKINDLRHNIYPIDIMDKYRCGILGLSPNLYNDDNDNKNNVNFLEELKEKEIISEYTFTVLLEDKNSLFDYNRNLNLGKIIIGESPYIFGRDKYKKDDEIVIMEKDWSI